MAFMVVNSIQGSLFRCMLRRRPYLSEHGQKGRRSAALKYVVLVCARERHKQGNPLEHLVRSISTLQLMPCCSSVNRMEKEMQADAASQSPRHFRVDVPEVPPRCRIHG